MSGGRVGRPYRFPTLRDTAAWEQEARRRRLIVGGLILAAVVVAFLVGGCNGAHGRC